MEYWITEWLDGNHLYCSIVVPGAVGSSFFPEPTYFEPHGLRWKSLAIRGVIWCSFTGWRRTRFGTNSTRSLARLLRFCFELVLARFGETRVSGGHVLSIPQKLSPRRFAVCDKVDGGCVAADVFCRRLHYSSPHASAFIYFNWAEIVTLLRATVAFYKYRFVSEVSYMCLLQWDVVFRCVSCPSATAQPTWRWPRQAINHCFR